MCNDLCNEVSSGILSEVKSLLSVGVRVVYLSNNLNQWNKRPSQDHSTARSNGTRWSKVIGRHLPIRTVAWHDHNVAVNLRAKMSASNKCQEILGTLSASISQAKGPWVRDVPSTVYKVWQRIEPYSQTIKELILNLLNKDWEDTSDQNN